MLRRRRVSTIYIYSTCVLTRHQKEPLNQDERVVVSHRVRAHTQFACHFTSHTLPTNTCFYYTCTLGAQHNDDINSWGSFLPSSLPTCTLRLPYPQHIRPSLDLLLHTHPHPTTVNVSALDNNTAFTPSTLTTAQPRVWLVSVPTTTHPASGTSP